MRGAIVHTGTAGSGALAGRSGPRLARGDTRARHGAGWLSVALIVYVTGVPDGVAGESRYPDRPVRMIVPYAPGGGADLLARALSVRLSGALGHSVIVDNRGGGGTLIGSELAARAPPDGHTILMVASTHAVVASLYRRIPYDPVTDFAPIIRVAAAPNLLVLHPAVPATTLKRIVEYVQSRPREIVYASSGNGGGSHLAMELLRTTAGLEMIHVPHKGSGPALVDVLSGQAQLMFGGMLATLTQVRAGKLRAVAVSTLRRSPAVPEIPTVAESGYPGYEAVTWYGVLAPARTPDPIVRRLNEEIARVLQQSEVRERLSSQGAEPDTTSPAQFAAYIRAEMDKWARVVKTSGARAD